MHACDCNHSETRTYMPETGRNFLQALQVLTIILFRKYFFRLSFKCFSMNDDPVHSGNTLMEGECVKNENTSEKKTMLTQCFNKLGQTFKSESCRPLPRAFSMSRFLSSCCLDRSFIVTQDLPKHHFKSCLFLLMRRYRTSLEGGECAGEGGEMGEVLIGQQTEELHFFAGLWKK